MSQHSLSSYIRKGSRIRPQAHGAFFNHGHSCALAAAYEAMQLEYDHRFSTEKIDQYQQFPVNEIQKYLDKRFPLLSKQCSHCPECGDISHLVTLPPGRSMLPSSTAMRISITISELSKLPERLSTTKPKNRKFLSDGFM